MIQTLNNIVLGLQVFSFLIGILLLILAGLGFFVYCVLTRRRYWREFLRRRVWRDLRGK